MRPGGEYEDLLKARRGRPGQGHPARRCRNAASIAALFLTTEAVVADKPGEGGPLPRATPTGGMGGMDF